MTTQPKPIPRTPDIATDALPQCAAQRIVSEPVADGYLERAKNGRGNRYRIDRNGHLRHPIFESRRSANFSTSSTPPATSAPSGQGWREHIKVGPQGEPAFAARRASAERWSWCRPVRHPGLDARRQSHRIGADSR